MLVTLLVGAIGLVGVGNKVDDVQDGVYAATLSTAQARIAGFDAKSNESLTLIARGSGRGLRGRPGRPRTTSSSASSTSSAQNAGVRRPRPAALGPLRDVHAQIRELDDGGNWDGAVGWPPAPAPSSGNATFADFDESSGEQLTVLGQDTATELDQAGGWLPFAAVARARWPGSIAALCAWWGVSQRLEEYR